MSNPMRRLSFNKRQLWLILGIAALAAFLLTYTNRLIRSSELRAEVKLWQQEVQLDQQRLQENQDKLAYSQTDQYVIEKAHSDLGWAFPHEVAVWVLGEERTAGGSAAQDAGQASLPFWQQWQQRFFGPSTR